MSKTCSDCGVNPGEVHHEGCDVERCSVCKGQRLMCMGLGKACVNHNPENVKWTGRWPGEQECEDLGWYIELDPKTHKIGPRCTKDHSNAFPDLNRWAVYSATGKDSYNEKSASYNDAEMWAGLISVSLPTFAKPEEDFDRAHKTIIDWVETIIKAVREEASK